HRSAEPGHAATLDHLGLRPLIDLGLRLGEGTGALLALPVTASAVRALREVATVDSAGVAGKNLTQGGRELMAGPDPAPCLLALRLAGRRVTIIGGGAVAARRIPALLDAGAEVVVVSPEVSPALAELAAAGRIGWARRGYAPGDCADSWLVS